MGGHCKIPKTTFNDTDLNELEWVFECACTTIKGHGLLTEDTKSFIRRRLFMLACNGMTDPDDLRDHLVANVTRQKLEPVRSWGPCLGVLVGPLSMCLSWSPVVFSRSASL